MKSQFVRRHSKRLDARDSSARTSKISMTSIILVAKGVFPLFRAMHSLSIFLLIFALSELSVFARISTSGQHVFQMTGVSSPSVVTQRDVEKIYRFCNEDDKNHYSMDVKEILISPNPPKLGQDVEIVVRAINGTSCAVDPVMFDLDRERSHQWNNPA